MVKWADYVITVAILQNDKNAIAELMVRQGEGIKLGKPMRLTREQVIKLLENNKSFVTGHMGCGFCKRGSKVNLIKIGENSYIRTDEANIAEDDLGDVKFMRY